MNPGGLLPIKSVQCNQFMRPCRRTVRGVVSDSICCPRDLWDSCPITDALLLWQGGVVSDSAVRCTPEKLMVLSMAATEAREERDVVVVDGARRAGVDVDAVVERPLGSAMGSWPVTVALSTIRADAFVPPRMSCMSPPHRRSSPCPATVTSGRREPSHRPDQAPGLDRRVAGLADALR